ncbi:MAG: hypothetical protein ACOY5C_02815 [Pseudomonadota bacterium]
MTIPRLKALHTHWAKWPPLHVMVAAYFGLGKEQKQATGDLGELIGLFQSMGGTVKMGET